jgi:hypothetical protein
MLRRIRTKRPLLAAVKHKLAATFALIVLAIFLTGSSPARAAQAPVGLGTATSFAVLAGQTITNTGSTTITGDVGLHPGTATPGWASVTQSGALHVNDAVAAQAKVDLVTAYNDAAGRTPVTTVATELGGQLLQAGVYTSASGTFGLTGGLTLDAAGDPSAVFIFQTASTLITASVSSVNLINGADACNVFWKVGSSATLGTGTLFKGSILALTSVTLTTAARIDGRALARNGAVTMDTNTITRGACAAAPTATPAASTSPSASASPAASTSPGASPSPGAGTSPAPATSAPPSATPTPVGASPTPTSPTSGSFPPSTPEVETPVGEGLPPTGASIATLVLAAFALIAGGQLLSRWARP